MNLKPKNYEWSSFYVSVVDLLEYSFSSRAILKRYTAMKGFLPQILAGIRGVASFQRIRLYREIQRRLDEDPQFRPFFEGETTELPQFYVEWIRKDLGPFWEWLPDGALYHDPNAYLKTQEKFVNTVG